MSDEMDMLPPEVAEAMNALYAFAGRTVDPTPCGIPMQGACLTIRDYLHRVTAEHAELSRGYEKWKRSAESVGDDLRALRQRAEHAEAELAEALAELVKLRAAPVFTCDAEVISGRDGDYMSMILTHADPAFQYPDLDDQHVRLVVD